MAHCGPTLLRRGPTFLRCDPMWRPFTYLCLAAAFGLVLVAIQYQRRQALRAVAAWAGTVLALAAPILFAYESGLFDRFPEARAGLWDDASRVGWANLLVLVVSACFAYGPASEPKKKRGSLRERILVLGIVGAAFSFLLSVTFRNERFGEFSGILPARLLARYAWMGAGAAVGEGLAHVSHRIRRRFGHALAYLTVRVLGVLMILGILLFHGSIVLGFTHRGIYAVHELRMAWDKSPAVAVLLGAIPVAGIAFTLWLDRARETSRREEDRESQQVPADRADTSAGSAWRRPGAHRSSRGG